MENNLKKDDHKLKKEYVQNDYVYWLNTRRYYTKTIPQNILVTLQPSKAAQERDWKNDMFAPCFHLSLKLEMDKNPDRFKAFLLAIFGAMATRHFKHMGDDIYNIKTYADHHNITLNMAYLRANDFLDRVWALAQVNQKLNEMYAREFTF